MATYDYLKSKNGHKIQVESAKRDGSGKNIENNYAKQNGYYAQLTSGNADQLNSTIFVTDQVPYLFRTSGGDADIGNREYDKIIGGSLAVNQLVQNGNFANSDTNWSFDASSTHSVANNVLTLDVSSSTNGQVYQSLSGKGVLGHKYLFISTIDPQGNSVEFYYMAFRNASWGNKTISTKQTIAMINEATHLNYYNVVINILTRSVSVKISNIQFIDLTAMFGSAIADYIYSLETNNAGSGVSWFRQHFQDLYYPYNTGAIKNVQLISHDTVGFNQWDEQWELGVIKVNYNNAEDGQNAPSTTQIRSKNYQRVFPNTTYYLKYPSGTALALVLYDANKNFIGYSRSADYGGVATTTTSPNSTYLIPNGVCFIRFYMGSSYGTTYNNDICINLSWSGWRNGQYEPYKKNSYPLDTTIELRGIPKLDADNHLYFDGDEYTYDGKVVRKRGSYTFTGNENIQTSTDGRFYWQGLSSVIKKTDDSSAANILIIGLEPHTKAAIHNYTNSVAVDSNGYVWFRLASDTTQAQMTTFLTGKTIEYDLASTTEETAQAYQEIQIVDDFGTEEYVVPTQDGWQIPVGHDTKYPANLRDKLQRLPDMPSVSQNVTETYVVNYNGTTKKCTFAEINTWLSANGYKKASELPTNDAVGGTLRQCLCVKESLDFDNTGVLDLSECNYDADHTNHRFIGYLPSGINAKVHSDASTQANILCSKYQTMSVNSVLTGNVGIGKTTNISVSDVGYETLTGAEFKAAMKGVLLAYEKA